jgi:hypothetical protein
MIYFAREKLGIYLNGFDWADGNDVLINMLHPSHSKSHTEATNHYSSLLVLESSNHNKATLHMEMEKESLQSNQN